MVSIQLASCHDVHRQATSLLLVSSPPIYPPSRLWKEQRRNSWRWASNFILQHCLYLHCWSREDISLAYTTIISQTLYDVNLQAYNRVES